MMLINSRRELYEYFDNAMNRSYEALKEEGMLEEKMTFLKTQIIEKNAISPEGLTNLIEGIRTRVIDKGLYELKIQVDKEQELTMYLDNIFSRFWLLHTLEKSENVKKVLRNLIDKPANQLDFPWFSSQVMLLLSRQNKFEGFSLKFNYLLEEDEKLSFRLWSKKKSQEVLQLFLNNKNTRNMATLTSIKIRKGDLEYFAISDLSRLGMISSRGTSFNEHFGFVKSVVIQYRNILNFIEENRLIYDTGIRGSTFFISVTNEIEHPENLASKLFVPKYPFRLWGLWHSVDGLTRVAAIDLHTNHRFNAEIMKEGIRIYLPKESCGNVVLRLLSNVQQTYDSQADLEVEKSGERVFQY